MSICKHYTIFGKVQGVSYRSFLKKTAWRIGITGWGRNLPNGTVEAFACGTIEQLDELEKELRVGSKASVVETVEAKEKEYENFNDFSIIGVK